MEGVAKIDETRPCTLCGSRDHQVISEDRGGEKICPFAFEDHLETRWPDPQKIAQQSGFNDRKAREAILLFYQAGSRSFNPMDGLIEEADIICMEANNNGFKRSCNDSDYGLLEDGEDDSTHDS